MCAADHSSVHRGVTPLQPLLFVAAFRYSSGIVAQLGIKILLCNFIMSTLYFVDPLCPYGGKYVRVLGDGCVCARSFSVGVIRCVGVGGGGTGTASEVCVTVPIPRVLAPTPRQSSLMNPPS